MADSLLANLTELASAYARSNTLYIEDGASKRTTLGNLLKALPGGVNEVSLGIAGASLTGTNDSSFVDIAGTWNTTGTPTAIKLNVTDTASNAASMLMDLQVGGSSVFGFKKNGHIKAPGLGFRGVSGGAFSFGSGTAADAITSFNVYVSGYKLVADSSGVNIGARLAIGGTGADSSGNAYLFSTSANVLEQRNGTSAQASRVYNTFTDASNNEYGGLAWNSNVLEIGSFKNGSGSTRDVRLVRGGTTMATLISSVITLGSGVQLYLTSSILYGGGTTSSYGFKRKVTEAASTGAVNDGFTGVYTNAGAGAGITLTLPTLVAGYEYTFTDNNASHRLTVVPASGDQIIWIDGTVVSNATGSIVSTAQFDSFTGHAVDATTFVVTTATGTFTVTP